MSPNIKIILYVVLGVCLAVCGYKAFQSGKEPAGTIPSASAVTNSASGTSDATVATNAFTPAPSIEVTNPVATTSAVVAVAAASSPAVPSDETLTARQSSSRLSRMMGFGLAAFLALVGLAILISQDVSRFLANRVDEFVFNDNLEGVKDPEYEECEDVWRKGQHLEAIRMMREYLKRHPREQYVALRIAEIYESDLRNYLAAALEYEEILKKRLPPERWGWAAIHLANLYSGKLDKAPEAEAILHRIIADHGTTAAARKARERLGIPEPVEVAAAPPPEPEPAPEPEKKKAEAEESNLPPGFRPK